MTHLEKEADYMKRCGKRGLRGRCKSFFAKRSPEFKGTNNDSEGTCTQISSSYVGK